MQSYPEKQSKLTMQQDEDGSDTGNGGLCRDLASYINAHRTYTNSECSLSAHLFPSRAYNDYVLDPAGPIVWCSPSSRRNWTRHKIEDRT